MKKNLLLLAGLLAISFSSSIFSQRIRLYNDSDKITIKVDMFLRSDSPRTYLLKPYGMDGYYQDIQLPAVLAAVRSITFTATDFAGKDIGWQAWNQKETNWMGNYAKNDIRFELFLKDNKFSYKQVDFDKSTAY